MTDTINNIKVLLGMDGAQFIQSCAESKNQFGQLKASLDQSKISFSEAQNSVNKLALELKTAKAPTEEMQNNLNKLKIEAAENKIAMNEAAIAMNKYKLESQSASNVTKTTGMSLASVVGTFTAIAAAAAAFTGAAHEVLDYDKNVSKLSKTLGTNAEQSSKMAAITQLYHVDVDSLTKGLVTLTANAEKNTKAFQVYNIATKDGNGNLLDANKLLMNVSDKYVSLGGGLAGAAMAQELLGKGGKDLIPVLNLGSKGIEEMEEKAKSMGLVLTSQNIIAFRQFQMSTQELKDSLLGLSVQIGNALMPIITSLSAAVIHTMEAFNSLNPCVRDGMVAVISLTTAIKTGLLTALKDAAIACGVLVMENLPLIAILGAVAAASLVLYEAWNHNWFGMRDTLINVFDRFKSLFDWFGKEIRAITDDLVTMGEVAAKVFDFLVPSVDKFGNAMTSGGASADWGTGDKSKKVKNEWDKVFSDIQNDAKSTMTNIGKFFTPDALPSSVIGSGKSKGVDLSEHKKPPKPKKGPKGLDDYEKAKDQYQNYLSSEEIKGVELTNNNKLAAYNSYLENVKKAGGKAGKEYTDFRKGQAQLVKAIRKDLLDNAIADLEVLKYSSQKTDEEIYKIDMQELNKKLAFAKKTYGEDSVAYKQALIEQEKAKLEQTKKLEDLEKQKILEKLQRQKESLDDTLYNYQLELEQGQITKSQELQAEINILDQKRTYTKQALAEELQLAKDNEIEKTKLENQNSKEIQAYDRQINVKKLELLKEQQKYYTNFSNSLASGWSSTIGKLMNGQITFKNAFQQSLITIGTSFTGTTQKMVQDFIAKNLTLSNISKSFSQNTVQTTKTTANSIADTLTPAITGASTATKTAATGMTSFASSLTPATGAVAAMNTNMGALALSAGNLSLSLPVISSSVSMMAASSTIAASGLTALNAAMAASIPSASSFAPAAAIMASSFEVIGTAASSAATAVAELAIALAASSVAGIPIVGAILAPVAAATTGAAITASSMAVQFREHGGPVIAGQPYIVGEKRPELFIPQTNGTILPNTNALNNNNSSGGDTHNHYYSVSMPVSAIDTKDFQDHVGDCITYVHSELKKGVRRGTLAPI